MRIYNIILPSVCVLDRYFFLYRRTNGRTSGLIAFPKHLQIKSNGGMQDNVIRRFGIRWKFLKPNLLISRFLHEIGLTKYSTPACIHLFVAGLRFNSTIDRFQVECAENAKRNSKQIETIREVEDNGRKLCFIIIIINYYIWIVDSKRLCAYVQLI